MTSTARCGTRILSPREFNDERQVKPQKNRHIKFGESLHDLLDLCLILVLRIHGWYCCGSSRGISRIYLGRLQYCV